jgi:hypothetical protein
MPASDRRRPAGRQSRGSNPISTSRAASWSSS